MSSDLVSPPNSGISPEDWQQTPESVRVWITVLGEEIKDLKDTVEKLQDIVNRNSGNSYRIGWNLKLQAEDLLVLRARVRDGTLSNADFMTEFPAV